MTSQGRGTIQFRLNGQRYELAREDVEIRLTDVAPDGPAVVGGDHVDAVLLGRGVGHRADAPSLGRQRRDQGGLDVGFGVPLPSELKPGGSRPGGGRGRRCGRGR